MFNTKNKTDMQQEKTNGGGATRIGAGTTLKGDISSNSDLQSDIVGKVSEMSGQKSYCNCGANVWLQEIYMRVNYR